jgi:hypothetical protein
MTVTMNEKGPPLNGWPRSSKYLCFLGGEGGGRTHTYSEVRQILSPLESFSGHFTTSHTVHSIRSRLPNVLALGTVTVTIRGVRSHRGSHS